MRLTRSSASARVDAGLLSQRPRIPCVVSGPRSALHPIPSARHLGRQMRRLNRTVANDALAEAMSGNLQTSRLSASTSHRRQPSTSWSGALLASPIHRRKSVAFISVCSGSVRVGSRAHLRPRLSGVWRGADSREILHYAMVVHRRARLKRPLHPRTRRCS